MYLSPRLPAVYEMQNAGNDDSDSKTPLCRVSLCCSEMRDVLAKLMSEEMKNKLQATARERDIAQCYAGSLGLICIKKFFLV